MNKDESQVLKMPTSHPIVSSQESIENVEALVHGDATPDQIRAIDHIGSHARLLAGPGTGKTKTLTHRVLSLVLRHNQDPQGILLLTFTRLAAGQLRSEIKRVLEPHGKLIPTISTLHSFALRQILFNASSIDALPRPIRIADDWEERYVIEEDLKRSLGLREISQVRGLIHQLSTDWETLRVEEQGWQEQFPNPGFLGAWRQHRELYGETLRAELVYQLKKQLNQNQNFRLDRTYKHVLIDEYQDLNACDLAIIRELATRGAEIFVAGDDDQSIYGFRYADPIGIRQFPEIYPGASRIALEICFRCDKKILKSADFVASLDHTRLPKPTRPRDGAEDGEVAILNVRDQNHEAEIVSGRIKELIDGGTPAGRIVILLRNDKNGALSKPLIDAMVARGVPVSLSQESQLESLNEYRVILSLIRLMASNYEDGLAWRAILQVERNNIGAECLAAIDAYAISKGVRFSRAIEEIKESSGVLPRFGARVKEAVDAIMARIETLQSQGGSLIEQISRVIDGAAPEGPVRESIKSSLLSLINGSSCESLNDLVRDLSASFEKIEQDTESDSVAVLTMHQAKGLTYDVCFIVGVEDEYIPGRNQGEKEGDERRLLYVSMTRARHKLFMTYCTKRIGQQTHTGRNSGNPNRTLTRFLRDSKIPLVRC